MEDIEYIYYVVQNYLCLHIVFDFLNKELMMYNKRINYH